ncbi:MAG: VCBS repeat-containing protein [Chloroflexi bacterium]|nr:VCBS repeat-containing protein [Chloroflexota bacterium]
MEQSHVQRKSRQVPYSQSQANSGDCYEEEPDDIWPTRMPTSTRRYRSDVSMHRGHPQADVQLSAQGTISDVYTFQRKGSHNPIPPRRTATQANIPAASRRPSAQTEEPKPYRGGDRLSPDNATRDRHVHWLVYVGVAMIVMLVGWMLLNILLNWWQVTQDDWHYGRPRTFQTDMVVGHNDSVANPSHFVALNLRRHVEVIEFPGGDSAQAKVYVGPLLIGPGEDLAVVTLSFKDVNGDGKPDMIVNVQGSHFVFINENGSFRPARPSDNVQF